MNLITRTIPALLLGLSGLALSGTSQADSSFSVTISSGYAIPHARYVYHDSYRPYARACNPYRRPLAHTDTYIEKRVYRDYGHHKRHHRDDDHHGYYGRHQQKKKYRNRDDHHSRGHGDKKHRRHHTGYAVTARY
jgi:hypothetical protein